MRCDSATHIFDDVLNSAARSSTLVVRLCKCPESTEKNKTTRASATPGLVRSRQLAYDESTGQCILQPLAGCRFKFTTRVGEKHQVHESAVRRHRTICPTERTSMDMLKACSARTLLHRRTAITSPQLIQLGSGLAVLRNAMIACRHVSALLPEVGPRERPPF